jgi:apolipoprotein N-acyltransferase
VVFDDLVRQSVRAGAQFIAVPTNNATFGRTDMTYQQQAMSRVRAVEHGRAVVIAATSGSSAVIAPDGTVEQHTDLFVPAVLVAEVPLRTTTTLATRLGAGPEWMLVTLAVAAVFAAAVTRGRDDAQTAVRTAASAGGTARDAAAGTANVTGHGMGSTLVVVPTYNERDNLGPVLRRLHAAVPAAHVLVVDDASPDGTGQLADELAATDDRICVLHRSTKGGLGTAYTAGFRWALERGYDVIVEMDADGSHAPEELPRLLTTLVRDGADVTMGSRYVAGGRVVNWPRHRKWLSRAGNLYSQIALGVTVADMTSGFRAYRRHVLAVLPLGEVASQGYCFQVDIAWRAVRAGFRVVEVPITFTERERGSSKMSGRIVREALWRVTRWGLRHRLRQLAGRGLRPNVSDGRGAR